MFALREGVRTLNMLTVQDVDKRFVHVLLQLGCRC